MQKMNKFVEKKIGGGGGRLKITFCFEEGLYIVYALPSIWILNKVCLN